MEIKVDHPLIDSEIARIRQMTTLKDFRNSIKKISKLLAFPVLSRLEAEEFRAKSVLGYEFLGHKIITKLVFIPILRAGFGMLDSFLEFAPYAKVAPIGLKRNSDLSIQTYFESLPQANPNSVAIVLEPILATGNTLIRAIEIILEKGYKKIVIATMLTVQVGIDKILERYPQISIFFCQKDPKLNNKGYIIPGIGDAGDRFFSD